MLSIGLAMSIANHNEQERMQKERTEEERSD